MSFRSRRNIFIGILFLAVLIVTSYNFLYLAGKDGSWGFAFLWVFVNGITSFIWLGIRYSIKGENLLIMMGPFVERVIPIKDLLSVQRSYELINSGTGPAFKKLKLRFKGGEALITPAREGEFLAELKRINPRLFIDLDMVTMV